MLTKCFVKSKILLRGVYACVFGSGEEIPKLIPGQIEIRIVP
jgi:hypothetical protein